MTRAIVNSRSAELDSTPPLTGTVYYGRRYWWNYANVDGYANVRFTETLLSVSSGASCDAVAAAVHTQTSPTEHPCDLHQ